MCNINLLIKRNKNKIKGLKEFINVITAVSYKDNSDGNGHSIDYKSPIVSNEKMIYRVVNFREYFLNHCRLSTSGFGIENHQPIESENFIIAHNGVLNNSDIETELKKRTIKIKDDYSDTKAYLYILEDEYMKTKNTVTAIKNTIEKISGTYSIVLIDKNAKKIYYFKESTTNINLVMNSDLLYITTNNFNAEYFKKYFNTKTAIKDIEPNKIYLVTKKGLIVKETFMKKTTIAITTNYKTNSKTISKQESETLLKEFKDYLDYNEIYYYYIEPHKKTFEILIDVRDIQEYEKRFNIVAKYQTTAGIYNIFVKKTEIKNFLEDQGFYNTSNEALFYEYYNLF